MSEVQESDPSAALLDVARSVVPTWLTDLTCSTAARHGVGLGADDPAVVEMVEATSARLIGALADLLGTDVDEQRTNPLSLFREAVAGPTSVLRDRSVPVPSAPEFEAGLFPDDVYGLGPVTWSDVHPDLHGPGLTWGAWKAMTVLRRRRAEGLG